MNDIRHERARHTRWVVMGVSGSGKSAVGEALAAALGVPFHEGDSDHSPSSLAKMGAGIPLDDDDRRDWLLVLQGRIRDAARRQEGLVLTCSALKRRYRDLLRAGDPELVFLFLSGSPELIASRMQERRGHFMPPALLASQLRDLEAPQPDEHVLQVDISEPPQVLAAKALEQFAQEAGGDHPA